MDNRLNADTPSVEQSLDQYLASVNKQFNEIENDINKIEQDQNKINQLEKDQADLASYIQTLSNLSGLDPTGGIEAQLEEMQDTYDEDGLLINLCNSDIDNLQSEIKKIDPQLAPIVDTLSLLLNASIGLGGAAKSKEERLTIQSYIKQIETALFQKAESDRYQAILSNDKDGKLSIEQVEECIAKIQALSGASQRTIDNLVGQMTTDLQKYHADSNATNVDAKSYNIWEDIFCGGWAKGDADQASIKNLSAMQDLISKAMSGLAGAASVDSSMLQLQYMLEDLSRKIEKILQDPALTLKEKQGKVLSLLMYVLGIIGLLKAESEASKASNEEKMSKSALTSSQMNLDDMLENQKIQAELAKQSVLTKKIMEVTQIIMFAVMAVFCPSAIFLVLLAADFVMSQLQDAGIMKESLGQMIGDKIGSQIGGEVIYAALEMALTGGLSAAGDLLVKHLAETSAKEIADLVVKEMETEVENSAKAMYRNELGDQAQEGVINQTKDLLTSVLRQTVRSAAKKAYLTFMEQSIGDFVVGGMNIGAKKAANIAGKEAAQNLLQEASTMTVTNFQNNAVAISEKVSSQAVSSSLGVKADDIAKTDAIGDLSSSRALWRLGGFSVYALGNTNIMSDLAKLIEKKSKEENLSSDAAIICSLLQSVLQMLALLISGSGMSLSGATSLVTRLSTVAQIGGMGSDAGLNLAQGQTYSRQGDVTRAILDNAAIADFLHQFLEQLQKNTSASRQSETQEIARDRANTRLLAGHTMDGVGRGIQVLNELAV